ncbi:hypothetical protein LTR67_006734 [Exophiala xenobiotica]
MAETMRQFLGALERRDPKRLPLAPDCRATQNELPIAIGKGIWETATKVDDYQLIFEDKTYEKSLDTLNVGFVGLIWRGKDVSLCSIRLKVVADQIAEIDLIQGDDYFPGSTASDPRDTCKVFRDNFAKRLPSPMFSRDRLVRIALLYYESIGSDDPCYVPFADSFKRIENGTLSIANPDFHQEEWYDHAEGKEIPNFAAMGAKEQHDCKIWSADLVTDKRVHVVDVERGLVWVHSIYRPWYRKDSVEIEGLGVLTPKKKMLGAGVATMTELIKIGPNGELEDMESAWAFMPKGTATIWATLNIVLYSR